MLFVFAYFVVCSFVKLVHWFSFISFDIWFMFIRFI